MTNPVDPDPVASSTSRPASVLQHIAAIEQAHPQLTEALRRQSEAARQAASTAPTAVSPASLPGLNTALGNITRGLTQHDTAAALVSQGVAHVRALLASSSAST